MDLTKLSYQEKITLLSEERKKALNRSSSMKFAIARAKRIQELESLILLDLQSPTINSKNIDGGTPDSDHTSIEALDGGRIA